MLNFFIAVAMGASLAIIGATIYFIMVIIQSYQPTHNLSAMLRGLIVFFMHMLSSVFLFIVVVIPFQMGDFIASPPTTFRAENIIASKTRTFSDFVVLIFLIMSYVSAFVGVFFVSQRILFKKADFVILILLIISYVLTFVGVFSALQRILLKKKEKD